MKEPQGEHLYNYDCNKQMPNEIWRFSVHDCLAREHPKFRRFGRWFVTRVTVKSTLSRRAFYRPPFTTFSRIRPTRSQIHC